jgi:hypothetical protein
MSVDVDRTIETVLSLLPVYPLSSGRSGPGQHPQAAAVRRTPEQQAELNWHLDAIESAPEDLLTWNEVLDELRSKL